MRLDTLPIGSAFRVADLNFKLIKLCTGSAYVEPLSRRRRAIKNHDGDTLAEFDSPGGRIHISRGAIVTRLYERDILDDDEEPDILDDEKETIMPTATKPAKTRISGDRKFEAKKQERPVREGTIRAKLLAAIESGKSDINKLMKEFGMARSLLIAHVHEFWNCHGYGYSVVGDVVKVTRPVGGVMKAAAAPAKKAKAKKKAVATADPFDDEDPLA